MTGVARAPRPDAAAPARPARAVVPVADAAPRPAALSLAELSPRAAWGAGLRAGDRIVAIDGKDIVSPEGGSRFADIEPGDVIVWTVDRSGRRQDIEAVAEERHAPRAWSTADPTERLIRFTGTVGGTTVEVSGARVSVTESEDGGLIVIQTGDNVIRIRATRPRGER